ACRVTLSEQTRVAPAAPGGSGTPGQTAHIGLSCNGQSRRAVPPRAEQHDIFKKLQQVGHDMLLMIDNYDSFTYNIVQYFGELGEDVRVVRNDQITMPEIEAMAPDRICISPGPGAPAQAGISVEAIRHFAGRLSLLGVCLG